MGPLLTRRRIVLARTLGVVVDLVQITFLPAFFPGAASPASTVIDVLTAGAMIGLIGWHWAFVPTFAIELLPIADLAPTWTAAVFLATRGRSVDVEATSDPAGEGGPPKIGAGQDSDSGS